MGKRSAPSVFDSVSALDAQDRAAEAKRRKQQRQDDRQSKAAQDQLRLHRRLVECRVLLQRSLSSSSAASAPATVDDCDELLGLLLEARRKLFLQGDRDGAHDSDEGNEAIETNDGSLRSYLSKVSSLNLDEVLQEEYEFARDSWKRVLNRRYADFQLRSGNLKKKAKKQQGHDSGVGVGSTTKFTVIDATFWQQVESAVAYEALQQARQKASDDDGDGELPAFDDSKVYRHLLNEFVSSSTADAAAAAAASSPAARNRKTTASSSSSSKAKQVDRRASKGRRIRYTEIPKLVNFAFPLAKAVPASATTVMDDDAWFASLFGRRG